MGLGKGAFDISVTVHAFIHTDDFTNSLFLLGRLDNIEERGSLFEGDMKLPPGMKAGIIGDNYRWPDQTLTYKLGDDFSQFPSWFHILFSL